MKVVINKCYGGFSLSPEAVLWLYKNGYNEEGFKTPIKEYWGDLDEDGILSYKEALKKWREYKKIKSKSKRDSMWVTIFTPDEKFILNERPSNREHELIVKCVETLGEKANGGYASLAIVEIPDGVQYTISEYDGNEHIAEIHRTWG